MFRTFSVNLRASVPPYLQHNDAERMYMFSHAKVQVKLAPQYCPHARPSTLRKAFSTLLLGLPHSSQEVVLFDFLLPCHPHRFLQLCSRFESSLTILLSHTSRQIYRLLFERHVEFRRDATGIECASSFGCESALLFGFRCVAPLSASDQRGKENVEPRASFWRLDVMNGKPFSVVASPIRASVCNRKV